LLIVSAGYDANHDDLISAISLEPKDFGILTHFLLKIHRRVLFGLEGGYELNSLAKSVVATIEACLKNF
jgi:acetoin utilization deacetylase AcuC-like enzyme